MSDTTNSDAKNAEELKNNDEAQAKQDSEDVLEHDDDNKNSASTDETIQEVKEDWKNKYYYVLAEMDNSRKRFQGEKENLIKYGNEKILSNLIGVIDNFDHSIKALENDKDPRIKNILHGIEMVRKQFTDVLSKEGLSCIDSVGQDFNPNFHEAMAKQKVEGKRDNEIIFEYQKGYVLNGRLIRPAKVIVAENKTEQEDVNNNN